MPIQNRHTIHISHYAVLLAIIIITFTGVLATNFNRTYQIIAVLIMSISYFLWGILHHLKQKDLHYEIVLEYLLIAILGATILISVIVQA